MNFISYPDKKRAEKEAHRIFVAALMLPGHTKMDLFRAAHREPSPPYQHKLDTQFLFTTDRRKLIKHKKRCLKDGSAYLLSIKQK